MPEKFTWDAPRKESKEGEEKVEIKELEVLRELPEFSGRSYNSPRGAIKDTKGLIVRVKFNQDMDFGVHRSKSWEMIVLLAEYASKMKGSEGPRWNLTDAKALESSGEMGSFEITPPNIKDKGPILRALEKKFVSDDGKLLE